MSEKLDPRASDATREVLDGLCNLADAGDAWFVSLGRGIRDTFTAGQDRASVLGDSARAAMETTTRLTNGLLDRLRGVRSEEAGGTDEPDVPTLVRELCELAAQGSDAVMDSEQFWSLVKRLGRAKQRADRAAARTPKKKRPAKSSTDPKPKAGPKGRRAVEQPVQKTTKGAPASPAAVDAPAETDKGGDEGDKPGTDE